MVTRLEPCPLERCETWRRHSCRPTIATFLVISARSASGRSCTRTFNPEGRADSIQKHHQSRAPRCRREWPRSNRMIGGAKKSFQPWRRKVSGWQQGRQRRCGDRKITAHRERHESMHKPRLETVVENANARMTLFVRRRPRARTVGVRHDAIHGATVEIPLSTQNDCQHDGCDRAQGENGARESPRAGSSEHGADPPFHRSLP
jgi:hypothetical protein